MAPTVPWDEPPLDEWDLVYAVHKWDGNTRMLHMSMTKAGMYVAAHGPDDGEVFAQLGRLAVLRENPLWRP